MSSSHSVKDSNIPQSIRDEMHFLYRVPSHCYCHSRAVYQQKKLTFCCIFCQIPLKFCHRIRDTEPGRSNTFLSFLQIFRTQSYHCVSFSPSHPINICLVKIIYICNHQFITQMSTKINIGESKITESSHFVVPISIKFNLDFCIIFVGKVDGK